MARLTRSSQAKKRKELNSVKAVSFNATCITLELTYNLLCPICLKKPEKQMKLIKVCDKQITNFRSIDKRHRCEQRWSEDCISRPNLTDN